MRRWSELPRPFLATLAAAFAVVAIFYGCLWMYAVRYPGPMVELGFNQAHNPYYDAKTRSLSVEDVVEGSPAARAGLRAGDRIIAVNGRELGSEIGSDESYVRGHSGDPVALTIERPGEPKPLVLHGLFRAKRTPGRAGESLARSSALEVIGFFPIPFLLVGFAVLFLKLEEPTAWLLALLFCAFAAAPDIVVPGEFSPAVRAFAFAFRAVFLGMLFPLFNFFFAVFPTRSPLDRRFPWLKWAGLALGVCIFIPGLRAGHPSIPRAVVQFTGTRGADMILLFVMYSLLVLGTISLVQNSFVAAVPAEARRKSRVILWGTGVGVLPIAVERLAKEFTGYHPSFWFDTALVLVLSLYPLSFAYAVVKHRVMDIPVLLRRSARYVLVQRGFFVLLFVTAAFMIALFTRVFSRFFESGSNVGMMLSAGFGIALVWVSAPWVKRGTDRIDRAFFRSAYDARVLLEELAEKTRAVTDRHELAALLEKHIQGALHPKSLACYLEAGDGNLVAERGAMPREFETIPAALPRPKFPIRFGAVFVPRELDNIPADMPLLKEISQRGKTWDVPQSPTVTGDWGPLAPECLVPILGRNSGLIGLLVLGPRLSEEPYSGEDKHLLDSVASQAGIALENIRLVETMAERVEADRRVAREMEIAREVQARLFPQKLPAMKTLEYIGGCIPARAVGGDYYDFLELREGRLALVLADIAGKGVSGALLMANLQASLRSQCAMAVDDLQRVLVSVNHSFCENTGEASYATLFFADYDDASRRLRYANCGHLPPLLLGAGASSENRPAGECTVGRLDANCMVVGLFEEWECEIAEVRLAPGDTLVLYTDGITEARNADGEEFGESRLLDILRHYRHFPVGALLETVVGAVRQFTAGEQQDDITLVIARSLASPPIRSCAGHSGEWSGNSETGSLPDFHIP
ncbi:MAG TPA: SpoIIE family protein phosphatase [Candidatus Acidoferrum sp.]|nr:SpoIIE family protein phosphatase [Candidatus Acidoferrum sp.]